MRTRNALLFLLLFAPAAHSLADAAELSSGPAPAATSPGARAQGSLDELIGPPSTRFT
jgi:hypothetical protein